jgi:hypothetical protein
MKYCVALVLGAVSLIAPGAASAQATLNRPALSPYLNLLQAGQSPGVNLYGIVRPEIEFRSSIQRLQQQVQTNQQAIDVQSTTTLPTTGHFAGFMTQGTYFQSFTGGAAGGSFGTAGGMGTGTGTGARPQTPTTAPRGSR